MSNHLKNQTSPYLLQHADNPVDWYPWCKEAFEKARKEDKPIFLSIGYSTCHWCHVMARESFADEETAKLLNKYFISIKVDKEERPDIDSIYMSVCQAFTGSGGWPTSIFMTAEQKPFFAGTYFPPDGGGKMISFRELLSVINDKWIHDRESLINSAGEIINLLSSEKKRPDLQKPDISIIDRAIDIYKQNYDEKYGGFGTAPKFPSPHNLLFLLGCYQRSRDSYLLKMVENTLLQMYRGGLFDHIGYGFCRYSTDRYFLAPHFEKMLYDNALLILAYCRAYDVTGNSLYLEISKKTAEYILREMTSCEGGFFCAQDADSDGQEGKYYLFTPKEIIRLLGEKNAEEFNEYFGITDKGNFEGKSIPNLFSGRAAPKDLSALVDRVREYRVKRTALHTDDKIITSWNSIMISAMCSLYRSSADEKYLEAARRAHRFIEENLCDKDTLYVSCRGGRRTGKGFLCDYAYYIFALLAMYDATLDQSFIRRAQELTNKAISDFYDYENGGFYLYGADNETLILRPKESYDGAMPSGNSIMTYNLVRLHYLNKENEPGRVLMGQLEFMYNEADRYPAGYAMFLYALYDFLEPPQIITAVIGSRGDTDKLPFDAPKNSIIRIIEHPTHEYPQINEKTTYYICKGRSCLPPVNDPTEIFREDSAE